MHKPLQGGPGRRVLADAGPFSVSGKGDIVYARTVVIARPEPMWILAAGQAAPVAFLPGCRSGVNPIWSPDGEKVFFYGDCGAQRGAFLAPRSGDGRRLLWERPAKAADTSYTTTPYWDHSRGSDSILLLLPGTGALFRLRLNGETKILTPGNHRWAAADPSGDLILTDYTKRMNIRSLDAKTGSAPTDPLPAAGHFSVSHDGRLLAFTRLTSGTTGELVLKNLQTGEQKVYAEHDQLGASFGSLWPIVSPDGKQVIYRVVGQNGGHFLLNTEGGPPRRVATMAQFQLGSDWSPDGTRVLGECPSSQGGICQLDPATGAVQPLFRHPSDAVLYPSWSWDGSAMTFMRRPPGGLTSIWIAPVAGGVVAPKESWFAISPPETDNSRPRFSPDGSTVYFMLTRGGVKPPGGAAGRSSGTEGGRRTRNVAGWAYGIDSPYRIFGPIPADRRYSRPRLLWFVRIDREPGEDEATVATSSAQPAALRPALRSTAGRRRSCVDRSRCCRNAPWCARC